MMEFLQMVWNSLTTENPSIITAISIPLIFIEVSISMLLFSSVLNIKADKKQKLLYVFAMSCTSILTRLLVPSPYNAFINFITTIIYIIIIFKTTIFKSIIALVFPIIVIVVSESIVGKLYTVLFGIDYAFGVNIPLHRIIGTLLLYFIMFVFYLIVKVFRTKIPNFEIFDKKKKILLALNIIFSIILISTQIYIVTFHISSLPFAITLLSILSLIAYFLVSMYTIFTTSKLETTSTNLEEAQLYNKTLEILQDNTRAFRHDFANILQGMVGYMDNNDMEGLKKYYAQLIDDIQHTNNLTTLSPKVVNNPAIYNVLATKYHKADSLGIKIHLEAFLDMNELHMKIYEFTRVLGILMDNAIEATSECENKVINVTFRKDSKRNMQLLIIENTYKNKDIDTDKIFEKGFSTKEGNTGLGLWEIRQILKKNNNLNLFTSKDENLFRQQFEIYY